MTTIAYRDGLMACDSQVTAGDMKYAKGKKIRKYADGSLLGVCGDWIGCSKLLALAEAGGGEIHSPALEQCSGAEGLYVRPDKSVYMVVGGKRGGLAPLLGPYFADGSGSPYALAAMKAGASAERAVEIASEFDVNSGGVVYTERLDEKPVVVKKRGRRTKR